MSFLTKLSPSRICKLNNKTIKEASSKGFYCHVEGKYYIPKVSDNYTIFVAPPSEEVNDNDSRVLGVYIDLFSQDLYIAVDVRYYNNDDYYFHGDRYDDWDADPAPVWSKEELNILHTNEVLLLRVSDYGFSWALTKEELVSYHKSRLSIFKKLTLTQQYTLILRLLNNRNTPEASYLEEYNKLFLDELASL